ncbi:MAG TPA: NUDIX domain-containing protein [Candidatus Saccharimonadales bacterium]|nr:NUDIX domain-containing protein [Candidatus Saccharimonadales bacterium]
MAKQSAGLLLYRLVPGGAEVLIVHPGGPFWAKKDLGSWSAPKGEFEPDEQPLDAAKREFQEEMGMLAPAGDYESLGEAKQPSGKVVHIFALAGNFDLEHFKSNMFEMEWPRGSSTKQEFPECDRAAWVSLATAVQKMAKGQVVFIGRLAEKLNVDLTPPPPPPAQASLF